MDRSDRFPLAPSYEPNPLRPYYVPPSIGPSAAEGAPRAPPRAPNVLRNARTQPSSYPGAASDLLPDLDLDLKSSAKEAWAGTRTLVDALAWRYASTLMAQPFDVAKTILQVSLPSTVVVATPKKRKGSPRQSARHSDARPRRDRAHGVYSESDERDDGDDLEQSEEEGIPDYFSSNAPRSRSPRRRRRTPPPLSPSPSPDPTPTPSRTSGQRQRDVEEDSQLRLKRPDSITAAITELHRTSGAFGLWRATNCTFLYSILLRTTDSFVRSLFLTLLGLPDILGPESGGLPSSLTSSAGAATPGLDVSDSPNPLASLLVIGLASCVTGILLAPLDLVRTRLIVAPTSLPPRGVLSNLRRLRSLLVPSTLWLPTGLLHSVPNILSASTPLFFRRQLRMTPDTTPGAWSLASFCTSLVELFTRLPLETMLRRAQVQALRQSEPSLPMIVEPAPYAGVMGTVYSILYHEGETRTKDAKGMVRMRKGQGIAGLTRGWRVGFWGLVGIWGAGALGPTNGGGRGEF